MTTVDHLATAALTAEHFVTSMKPAERGCRDARAAHSCAA